jgi:hypothetical protein
MMQPKHTFLFHDLRPTKAGLHHALDCYERGEITLEMVRIEIQALADSIPDVDASEYTEHQGKLLVGRNIARARKLVDCLGDRTLRPWVLPTAKTIGFFVKWGLILGAIYLVVRLAVG